MCFALPAINEEDIFHQSNRAPCGNTFPLNTLSEFSRCFPSCAPLQASLLLGTEKKTCTGQIGKASAKSRSFPAGKEGGMAWDRVLRKWWSHQHWNCSENEWMRLLVIWLIDQRVFSQRLDLRILEVLSSFYDSIIAPSKWHRTAATIMRRGQPLQRGLFGKGFRPLGPQLEVTSFICSGENLVPCTLQKKFHLSCGKPGGPWLDKVCRSLKGWDQENCSGEQDFECG